MLQAQQGQQGLLGAPQGQGATPEDQDTMGMAARHPNWPAAIPAAYGAINNPGDFMRGVYDSYMGRRAMPLAGATSHAGQEAIEVLKENGRQ